MNEQSTKKIVVSGALLLIVALVLAWLYYGGGKTKVVNLFEKPVIVEETFVTPNTKEVTVSDIRSVNSGAYNVPLVPLYDAQKVVVPNAAYTLKESYSKGEPFAVAWSPDAKLVLVKSLGAVTLEGKSSQWQVIFGSKIKQSAYEIIIQADKVVSQKEVDSTSYGYDLPKNWYEASDAIISLQTLPQFSGATVSGINFFYNTDSKIWGYGFATSKGATAMPVR